MKENSEDRFKEYVKTCETLEAVLNARIGECKIESFISVLNSLKTLRDAILEFCQMYLNVFGSYKKHDDEAPYCYVNEPPSLKSADKKFGFPIDLPDALTSGTKYYLLYDKAANALTQQCRKYVEECDHIDFYE